MQDVSMYRERGQRKQVCGSAGTVAGMGCHTFALWGAISFLLSINGMLSRLAGADTLRLTDCGMRSWRITGRLLINVHQM